MSSRLVAKIKPKSGLAHIVHLGFTVLLPILLFILVRVHFAQLALTLILLSKWRMFAVKPRHWPANIRANAIDLTVGISLLIFMLHVSDSTLWQALWAVLYGLWLLFLKPRSSLFMISIQALVGQTLGLMALFLALGAEPIYILVGMAWLVCYSAARHFFTSFDEPLTRWLAYLWGYFAAALIWVLSHWLLFYGVVAQATVLLSVLGFGLSAIYYLERTDRLSKLLRRQIVFVMIAIVVITIAFSNWGDKIT